MFLRRNRARRHRTLGFAALIATATLGGLAVVGFVLRSRHHDFPWTKRAMVEVHV